MNAKIGVGRVWLLLVPMVLVSTFCWLVC